MKINVTINEVSHENLVDLFSTAIFYNYKWMAYYDYDTYERYAKSEGDCFEDKLARLLLKGFSITIGDSLAEDEEDVYGNLEHYWDEDEECMMYTVKLSDVISGLEKASKNYNHLERVLMLAHDPSQMDIYDADILLQYIVFGEYIYC